MTFLFSFSGRVGRMGWVLGQLSTLLFAALGMFIIAKTHRGPGVGAGYPRAVLMIGLFAIYCWINLVLMVKRFHDRDKRWFWMLIGAIPWVGMYWQFGECAFLPGSPGRNRFGEPPGFPKSSKANDITAPSIGG